MSIMDEILAQTGMMGFFLLAGADPEVSPMTPNDLLTMWYAYGLPALHKAAIDNLIQLPNWPDRTRTDLQRLACELRTHSSRPICNVRSQVPL